MNTLYVCIYVHLINKYKGRHLMSAFDLHAYSHAYSYVCDITVCIYVCVYVYTHVYT